MALDPGLVALLCITLFAAAMNGALGYGFSSLTVPVALLFFASRALSPALVLVEVVLNAYVLVVNRRSFSTVWRRVIPVLIGVAPGVLLGSYALSVVSPGPMKLVTYVVLLPLILLQAAGLRRPVQSERLLGLPVGFAVGTLYSVTTISGPPLALMLNNQGLVKEEFRAALGVVRVFESSLTAAAYYFLGLYTVESLQLVPFIVPSIVIGLPLGAHLIRRMNQDTFRRICMSFDAWIVGFGLSRTLIDLKVLPDPAGFIALVAAGAFDLVLLYRFFNARREEQRRYQPAPAAVALPSLDMEPARTVAEGG